MPSFARTGVRPMRSATAARRQRVRPVASPATTSTSRISGGGLKKCMPQIRSGRSAPAARAVTESDEVLVASTASGPQAASRPANSSRLSSIRSGAASTTSSQPPRSSSSAPARAARRPPRPRRRSSARARRRVRGRRAPARPRARAPPARDREGRSRSRPGRRAGRCRRPSSPRPRRRPARSRASCTARRLSASLRGRCALRGVARPPKRRLVAGGLCGGEVTTRRWGSGRCDDFVAFVAPSRVRWRLRALSAAEGGGGGSPSQNSTASRRK